MPQGTKLGPWLFLVLINGLNLSDTLNAQLWKYVNDMMTSEVVAKGSDSNAQQLADHVAQWSSDNICYNSAGVSTHLRKWTRVRSCQKRETAWRNCNQ